LRRLVSDASKTLEKLIEASKAWAATYNKDGFDVTDVTEIHLPFRAKNMRAITGTSACAMITTSVTR
jgi:hypothetical protein